MAQDRVVALVDMDCFYVQVEQRLNPSLYGKPCAVVQYNHWKGGGIIAVGYEARKFGVTRNMRGDEATEKCPDIFLARVPEARGKADLTRYRDAGAEVLDVLQTFSGVCERASVDEAYLDMTEIVARSLESITLESLAEQTLQCCHIVGFTDQPSSDEHDIKGQWLAALSNERNRYLAMGALIIQKAREAVKEKTGFTCSAGIAHNKVLAKLAGGTYKPNQQTLLPHQSVAEFFQTIPIRKVRYFGGKFGQTVVDLLQVEKMAELTKFPIEELKRRLGEKSGSWLYHVCRGVDNEVVRSRQLAKSTGCGKNFPGKMKLVSKEKVRYWMSQLADELSDRLKGEVTKNNRTPKLVSVGLSTENNTSGVMRSFQLRSTNPQSICDSAMQVIKNFNLGTGDTWHPAIISLNINASKFEEISKSQGSSSIASFFAKKEDRFEARPEIDKDKELTADESAKTVLETSATSPRSTEKHKDVDLTDEQIDVELESPVDEPRSSFGISRNDTEPAMFDYTPDEIDQSIVSELPQEIRNEIQAFLGTQKTPEKSKRSCNGIAKYAISESSKSCTSSTEKPSLPQNTDGKEIQASSGIQKNSEGVKRSCDGIAKYAISESSNPSASSTEKRPFTRTDKDNLATDIKPKTLTNFGSIELINCSRCSQKVSAFEMSEHMDFHFAMELQKNERLSENVRRKKEPPKKRQKSTIDNFFVSKGR